MDNSFAKKAIFIIVLSVLYGLLNWILMPLTYVDNLKLVVLLFVIPFIAGIAIDFKHSNIKFVEAVFFCLSFVLIERIFAFFRIYMTFSGDFPIVQYIIHSLKGLIYSGSVSFTMVLIGIYFSKLVKRVYQNRELTTE